MLGLRTYVKSHVTFSESTTVSSSLVSQSYVRHSCHLALADFIISSSTRTSSTSFQNLFLVFYSGQLCQLGSFQHGEPVCIVQLLLMVQQHQYINHTSSKDCNWDEEVILVVLLVVVLLVLVVDDAGACYCAQIV